MIRFPPKNVLVALDMSEESMLAWEHGGALRRRFGCKVEAAFVATAVPGSPWDALPRPSRAAGNKAAAALKERIGAGEKVIVTYGDPVLSLARLARQRRADLIVIGPHARTTMDRVLHGSVTESLIRESQVPVLAVHGRPREVVRVLAPVSDKPYSQSGLLVAAAAAAAYQARLDVLRVFPESGGCASPEFALDALVRKLPKRVAESTRPETLVRYGRVEDEILEASRGRQLIVMTAHRKRLLQDLRHNMTAAKVLRHVESPVLVVPEPRSIVSARWTGRAVAHAP